MLAEFKEFVQKFNVVPIAVGLVLAFAFTPMVDAAVEVILSIVAGIFGSSRPGGFSELTFDVRDQQVPYGALIQAAITFLMIAFVVFWIVKALKRAGVETGLKTPDVEVLEEIRDELRAQRG